MTIDVYTNNQKYNIDAGSVRTIIANISIASADAANGDIYRVATLPVDAVITNVKIKTTALTSATDNDLGFYKTQNGSVVDADILVDGQVLVGASKSLDGLKDVSVANTGKTIYDLYKAVNSAGTALDGEKYVDVALTINTAPTANGDISIEIDYMMGK